MLAAVVASFVFIISFESWGITHGSLASDYTRSVCQLSLISDVGIETDIGTGVLVGKGAIATARHCVSNLGSTACRLRIKLGGISHVFDVPKNLTGNYSDDLVVLKFPRLEYIEVFAIAKKDSAWLAAKRSAQSVQLVGFGGQDSVLEDELESALDAVPSDLEPPIKAMLIKRTHAYLNNQSKLNYVRLLLTLEKIPDRRIFRFASPYFGRKQPTVIEVDPTWSGQNGILIHPRDAISQGDSGGPVVAISRDGRRRLLGIIYAAERGIWPLPKRIFFSPLILNAYDTVDLKRAD